jgi:hypothetical protein
MEECEKGRRNGSWVQIVATSAAVRCRSSQGRLPGMNPGGAYKPSARWV